jgi:hypothetical protein
MVSAENIAGEPVVRAVGQLLVHFVANSSRRQSELRMRYLPPEPRSRATVRISGLG